MFTLKSFSSRIEADMWSVILSDNSIPFIIQGDDCGGMRPFFGRSKGVDIIVNEEDLPLVKSVCPDLEVEVQEPK